MRPRRWHVRIDRMLGAGMKWYTARAVLDTYISTYGTKFAPTSRELSHYLDDWSTESIGDGSEKMYRRKSKL